MGRGRNRRRRRKKELARQMSASVPSAAAQASAKPQPTTTKKPETTAKKETTPSGHHELRKATRKPVKLRDKPPGVLRFSPKAWVKVLWFRDRGDTEIAGFGISRKDDPGYVIDFYTVKQEASTASFEMDDDDVNRFLGDCVEQGYHPAEVMRIFLHTHPGNSPHPSGVDENCFSRVFCDSDWGVMFIVAKDGSAYGRVRFNNGPGGVMELDHEVDYSPPFEGISREEYESWEDEYIRNIQERHWVSARAGFQSSHSSHPGYGYGYGGYDREDYDWRNAWGGDDGHAGFHSEPEPSPSEVKEKIDEALSSRANEDDTVSGGTEVVLLLDITESYRIGVYTDAGYYVFRDSDMVVVKLGDSVDFLSDFCANGNKPYVCGAVEWHTYGSGKDKIYVPTRLSRIFNGGSNVVEVTRPTPEGVGVTPDGEARIVKYDKTKRDTVTEICAAEKPGFAPETSEADKKTDVVPVTSIIEARELMKRETAEELEDAVYRLDELEQALGDMTTPEDEREDLEQQIEEVRESVAELEAKLEEHGGDAAEVEQSGFAAETEEVEETEDTRTLIPVFGEVEEDEEAEEAVAEAVEAEEGKVPDGSQ